MPSDLDDRARVKRVMLEEWDPHDAYKRPEAHGAYDAWVEPVYDLIRAGAAEEQIMEWLHEREHETMCFPSLGRERLRRVSRLLRLIPAQPSQ
jgi:hypothetical protein